MNLYHVSELVTVTSDFVKCISGLLFSSWLLIRFCLCYRFPVGFLTQVHEVFSLCLLYNDLQLSNGKRGKHVFIYWQKYGLEKQCHTDKSVPFETGFLFIVKQSENRELLRVLCSIKDIMTQIKQCFIFSTKLFGFWNVSINFIYWYCSIPIFLAMLCIWTYVHLAGKLLECILERIRFSWTILFTLISQIGVIGPGLLPVMANISKHLRIF